MKYNQTDDRLTSPLVETRSAVQFNCALLTSTYIYTTVCTAERVDIGPDVESIYFNDIQRHVCWESVGLMEKLRQGKLVCFFPLLFSIIHPSEMRWKDRK